MARTPTRKPSKNGGQTAGGKFAPGNKHGKGRSAGSRNRPTRADTCDQGRDERQAEVESGEVDEPAGVHDEVRCIENARVLKRDGVFIGIVEDVVRAAAHDAAS